METNPPGADQVRSKTPWVIAVFARTCAFLLAAMAVLFSGTLWWLWSQNLSGTILLLALLSSGIGFWLLWQAVRGESSKVFAFFAHLIAGLANRGSP
jgi:hypothetical protein